MVVVNRNEDSHLQEQILCKFLKDLYDWHVAIGNSYPSAKRSLALRDLW